MYQSIEVSLNSQHLRLAKTDMLVCCTLLLVQLSLRRAWSLLVSHAICMLMPVPGCLDPLSLMCFRATALWETSG